MPAILPLSKAVHNVLNYTRPEYTIQLQFNALTLCHQLALNGSNKKDKLGNCFIAYNFRYIFINYLGEIYTQFKLKMEPTLQSYKAKLESLPEDELVIKMKSTVQTSLSLL